jgi:hypothetical protein
MSSSNKFLLFLSLVYLQVAPSILLADSLHNCGGVWKSKPCDASSDIAATSNVVTPEDSEKDRLRKLDKDKRYLVLQLDLLRYNAAKELGLDLSISTVSLVCKSADTTLLRCGEIVTKRQAEIEAMLIKHRDSLRAEAAEQKRDNANKKSGQDSSVNQTLVTVVRPVAPSPWIHGLPRCCQDTCRLAQACRVNGGFYDRYPIAPQPSLSPGYQYPPAGRNPQSTIGAPSGGYVPPSADPRHFPYYNLPEYRQR